MEPSHEYALWILSKFPVTRMHQSASFNPTNEVSRPIDNCHLSFHLSKGVSRDFTEKILEACGINTTTGITHLTDRCLPDIDWRSVLRMHSLIQEMRRDEERQESPDKPWKRSRIWCHKEAFKVLKQKKVKGNLLGLSLDMWMLEKEKLRGSSELKTAAFSNMESLMILHLDYAKINGLYENFPEELRWLRMCGFPSKSIPSELPMENLVALDMSYSNIEFFDMSCSSHQRAEKKQKLLGSLKILYLSFSKQLRSVRGFCELPSLESLFLSNCSSLIEICESIDHCDELDLIDLTNCQDLQKLPRTLAKLKKVKTLLLDGWNYKGELAVVEAVPRDLKSSAVYFPSSLVKLSHANNNLSNESFPMDLSCLSMLKKVCLNGNPIVSMPDCVRTLPRLKKLYMESCEMLGSIEHPPRMIKIQPIADVDDTILCSLGWSNLEFIYKRRVGTYHHTRGPEEYQTQMYYEFGIFSTIYGGEVMPEWTTHKSKGPSISFTIPSSPNKLRGLNLSYNLTWSYSHRIGEVNEGGKSLTFLSHWMFGENEMEDGDQITISIKHTFTYDDGRCIRECGVSFVYDNGKNEKEEDPLSYYKSWNHIIGGDLSPFQLTTPEYKLYYLDNNTGRINNFKAFSEKNSNTHGCAIEFKGNWRKLAKDWIWKQNQTLRFKYMGDIVDDQAIVYFGEDPITIPVFHVC
ncbi:toll/interleukin-1 receptor (TIR) domain-containing protein [Artemisia annua]|uniref:Toll/interleukin-1 receptor (TIR) domain-containing protein n=1 Tax=Artemisia annua TaxID=35608 RepID=A0A2U1L364_ARTAN|nr:toll/interleukin-1 receptor (TIR) domain-containing protein [Artemisia annua]